MLKVYNYMAGGLTVTALTSYLIITNPDIFRLFFYTSRSGYTPFGRFMLFAPFFLVFAFKWVIQSGTVKQLQAVFWIFSSSMGASLAPLFLGYTGISLTKTFLICSATFGTLSLYGYTTKKDLTGMATFLIMTLVGLLFATVVSIFLMFFNVIDMFSFLNSAGVSFIYVLIFAGLTAYETQKLKEMYYANSINEDGIQRRAIAGALSLYLDFINMFTSLLRFFGDRK